MDFAKLDTSTGQQQLASPVPARLGNPMVGRGGGGAW